MKKTICLLLVCLLCILPLTSCGEQIGNEKENEKEKIPSEVKKETIEMRDNVIVLTIAQSDAEKQAIVPDESMYGNDVFYASDAEGVVYCVQMRLSDKIQENKTVYVMYQDGDMQPTEAEDTQGFAPQYAIEAYTVWTEEEWRAKDSANEIASEAFGVPADHLKLYGCYFHDNGYYFSYAFYLNGIEIDSVTLNFDESGALYEEGEPYSEASGWFCYMGTVVEEKLPDAVQRLCERTGKQHLALDLRILEDGYVCITTEVIENISPDDPEYGESGCMDHKHVWYSERIAKM